MPIEAQAVTFRRGAGAFGFPAADINLVLSGALLADALILGIPFDGGVASLPGQRHGPEIFRHYCPVQSWEVDDTGTLSGLVDPVSMREVLRSRRIFDVGDLGSVPIDPRISRSSYYKTLSRLSKKTAELPLIPIFIGGDHSISSPIVTGISDVCGSIKFVCFDAHCDFHSRPMSEFDSISHADFLGHLYQTGAITGADLYGVRTYLPVSAGPIPQAICCKYEYDLSACPCSSESTYLSIDLDVIDPSELAGTGHPEAGGYRLQELLQAIEHVCQTRHILAVDIVEASYEEQHNRATAAVISKIVMTCLRALLEPNDNLTKGTS